MLFDVGFAPIITLLIAIVAVSILADFLLELVSVRLTLSSGRFQNWLFQRLGRNVFCDIVIGFCFQFISFRKKAFFMQLSSFVNVGSFSKRQTGAILLGSFIGLGISCLVLALVHPYVAIAFVVSGFILSLLSKDQLKDLGVSLMNMGLLLVAIYFFNSFLIQSSLNIHQYKIGEGLLFIIVAFSSIFFRTPIAFLLMLSMLQYFMGLNIIWFPILFFIHGLLFLSRYYSHFFKGHQRVFFCLGITLFFQIIQLVISLVVAKHYGESVLVLGSKSFLTTYWNVLLLYTCYFSVSLLFVSPLIYLLLKTNIFSESDDKPKQSQKIFNTPQRGDLFSLHFSLFLLRHEFIKFTTLVHTIFKLSREINGEEETVSEKLERYQRILIRVGEEIKELCFSVGKQRSYRWHVQEILGLYKDVNQLELLVDDLSQIFILLQKNGLNEDWEKECRYWLSLQLLIFESFFNHVLGVGKDESEKVKANIQKSYDVLDRLFSQEFMIPEAKELSKNFYRVTESNGVLGL